MRTPDRKPFHRVAGEPRHEFRSAGTDSISLARAMLAIPAAIGPIATRKMGLPEKKGPKLMGRPMEMSAMPFRIDGWAMSRQSRAWRGCVCDSIMVSGEGGVSVLAWRPGRGTTASLPYAG